MPFDKDIDMMVRAVVDKDNMTCKKMFGGTCYLHNEKMVCGVWRDYLILRVGQDESGRAINEKKAKAFDITGKAMKGWIMIPKKSLIKTLLNHG